MKIGLLTCFLQSISVLVSCSPSWNNVEISGSATSNSNFVSDDAVKNKVFHEPAFDDTEDTLNSRIIKPRYCQRPATCERLKYSTCFGVKLPYTSTSLSLVPGLTSQEDVQEKLQKWRGLMHIPRCWAVVQPFLCSLYMPKCDNGMVDLPSLEMCEIIRSPCRILRTDNLWPSEFKCDPSYKSKCKNDVRELKFNTTSRCKPPLVRAEHETSFYEGVEGCGVQCHDPLFSDKERQEIRTIVVWGSAISFFCNLFAVLTFVIDWAAAKKYPVQVVFYMNFCFLMVSLGYIYQFRPGANDHTICHEDGTLRTSEPSIRENLSCVVSFVIVYYFLVAGIVWFIIFAYTWLLRSQAYDGLKDRRDKRGPYYHLTAWSTPFVLMVTILALGEVDGDSLLGICFVGVVNKQMRAIFLLVPLLWSVIGLFFFLKCIVNLIRVKRTSRKVLSVHAKAKIWESIVRVMIFLVLIIFFTVITFICHLYDFKHHQSWKESFRSYIVCQLGVVGDIEVENCRMQNRPSVLMVQLQLIALFGTHINMASWVWTSSTVQTWLRFYNKMTNNEAEEPVKLKKHKVIARAFAKRKLLNSDGLNSDGVLSISIRNSHQDPVGLDFELNSMESNESTTWAKIIPKLMTRRGALTPASGSNSSQRRNSMDSEISYSVRRVSVESRRHSLDSTVSVQAVEVTETVRKRPRDKRHRKDRRHKKSSSRKISSRRNNNMSQASNLEMEVLTALKIGNSEMQPGGAPNMNRRLAISDIEKNCLKLLNFTKTLPDQLMHDEVSFSNNSLDLSKAPKSEDSESGSDSESCHETEPLKWTSNNE